MRKVIILFVFSVFSLVAIAQSKQTFLSAVRLDINSESGVYAKGDTVKVYGSLTEPYDGELSMKIYVNGSRRSYKMFKQTPEERSVSLGTEPSLIYSAVFNEPTSVMLGVAPVTGGNLASMVGFCVAPEEFRPGYEMPQDFMKYWDKQKKSLRRSRMKVKRIPVEIKNVADAKTYDAWDLEISMPEGNPARGYLVLPKNAKKKSLPIFLFVHSAGVNRYFNYSKVENCIKYAKYSETGAIVLDLNAHGYLNGQPQEYYDALNDGKLNKYSSSPFKSDKDFYFRLMFLREQRAMDYLCGLPEWNGKTAIVYGESQGGAQALALSAIDNRISACVANVPGMADLGAPLLGRQGAWPVPYDKETIDTKRNILSYFDGALFLQHIKCSLFVVAGWIDETCFASGIHAGYNLCPSEDKVIYDNPYRWHSGTNPPFDKKWNSTIGRARTEFIEKHLND